MGTKTELAAIIGEVVAYFQTKLPPDRTIDLWFRKIDSLHLRAAHQRIVDIITNGESLPRNFPAAIKSAYSTWLRDQPRERQEAEGCSACLGGLIHAKKGGNIYTFRCGRCNTYDAGNIPMRTTYQLEEQGYTLDWQHDFKAPVDYDRKKEILKLVRASLINQQRGPSEPELIPFNNQF